ncbi:MAG: histidinol-phosphate transaminase [Rhodospirillales bacterium]|nr:histidinol-phosphate transaminase [Rhodospirillales bacterium]MCB9964815.1 histidinol-phosphate transaminase [Rhodospirillales bacterium]MCB9980478.1 histidinol-phosphate transaminase [Rhodospirillales bacterium]
MSESQSSILTRLLRQDLRSTFTPYSSAAGEMGKQAGAIYLNANENPYPFDGLQGLERYDLQQPVELLQAMADTFGVSPAEIVATRGSDESIDLLIRMLCTHGRDSILICPPTFGMYQVYAGLNGAQTVKVPLREQDGTFYLDTDRIIATAKDPAASVKAVFLCYPNAPSGTLFDPAEIEKIADALRETCAVVVDEAYIDFTQNESFCKKRALYPNMLILRTLSKAYALAGERVGCTICADLAFLRFMRGCLAPYPIAKSVARNAVTGLTLAKDGQAARTARIIANREKLVAAFLSSDDIAHVYPSETNFLLVKFKSYDAAQGYLTRAAARKIILRDISNKTDTPNCLRISIGNEDETAALIALL